MFEKIKELATLHSKLEFHLFRLNFGYGASALAWHCSIKLEDDGMKLEASVNKPLPEEAVDEVYEKFMRLVKQGAPQLLKLVEYKPDFPAARTPDEPGTFQPDSP